MSSLARTWRRFSRVGLALLASLLVLPLTACSGGSTGAGATAAGQPPQEYLTNVLDWIEEHSLQARAVPEWMRVRQDALALTPHPRTTADTYPAIRLALDNLHDASAFFLEPADLADYTGLGATLMYPSGLVVFVEPHSPAALAGVREGDLVQAIGGAPIRPLGTGPGEGYVGLWFVDVPKTPMFTLVTRPAGQDKSTTLDVLKTSTRYDGEPTARRFDGRAGGDTSVGYIELPWDAGWGDYPTRVQRAIRATDSPATCGWVVDLRRNVGGDFWTYLAGIGPILGEADLGGFVFPSGAREQWGYHAGKVVWDARLRDETYVADPIYVPKRQLPPVAVLTSEATFAAGELLRVAFQGRPNTRSFGAPTGGRPVLQLHTTLSDGGHISLAAAYAFDRTGQIYDRPIPPDETVGMDWPAFGTSQDRVLAAALQWLRAQRGCDG